VLVVLQPWAEGFNAWSLLPILAAALWGGASLITRALTATESSVSITLWLLLLLTPINLGLSVANGFEVPMGNALWLIILAGFLQFLAQYFLTRAYAAAEATYLQPFDDLRLPFNILAGFLAFGYLPVGNLWIGIALIVAGTAYLVWSERQKAAGLTTA
jgi:S-adenosylmethionine uptake transporter